MELNNRRTTENIFWSFSSAIQYLYLIESTQWILLDRFSDTELLKRSIFLEVFESKTPHENRRYSFESYRQRISRDRFANRSNCGDGRRCFKHHVWLMIWNVKDIAEVGDSREQNFSAGHLIEFTGRWHRPDAHWPVQKPNLDKLVSRCKIGCALSESLCQLQKNKITAFGRGLLKLSACLADFLRFLQESNGLVSSLRFPS